MEPDYDIEGPMYLIWHFHLSVLRPAISYYGPYQSHDFRWFMLMSSRLEIMPQYGEEIGNHLGSMFIEMFGLDCVDLPYTVSSRVVAMKRSDSRLRIGAVV